MGRSFDRGGQSRKERERGKRRSYRQAERNREALEAVARVKRKGAPADAYPMAKAPRIAAATVAVTPRMHASGPIDRPAAIIEQKRPGLIAKFFGIFKKSA